MWGGNANNTTGNNANNANQNSSPFGFNQNNQQQQQQQHNGSPFGNVAATTTVGGTGFGTSSASPFGSAGGNVNATNSSNPFGGFNQQPQPQQQQQQQQGIGFNTSSYNLSRSLSVSATISNGDNGNLTYQWKNAGTNVSGATSSSYTFSAGHVGLNTYTCLVSYPTDELVSSVTSDSITDTEALNDRY